MLAAVPHPLKVARAWLRAVSEDPRDIGLTVALALFAFVPRAWFVLWEHRPDRYVAVDMAQYVERAQRLLAGGLTADDAFLPAGYPALVAAVLGLSDGSLEAVAWAQLVASTASVCLAYWIARKVVSRNQAIVAALVLVVYVPLIFYTGFFLTETALAFALLAAVLLAVRAAERPTYGRGLAAGLTMAGAYCIHPNAILLLVGVLAAGRLKRIARPFTRSIALGAAPLLIAFAAFNSAASGRLALASTNGGINFFMARSDYAAVRCLDSPLAPGIAPRPNALRSSSTLRVSEYAYNAGFFSRMSVQQILREPWDAVRKTARNVAMGPGLGALGYWPGSSQHDGLLEASRDLFAWLAIVPALAWIAVLAVRRQLAGSYTRLVLVLAVGTIVVTHAAYLGDPRIRVPFDAFIVVLAVEAWVRAFRMAKQRVSALVRRGAGASNPAASATD